MQSMFGSLFKSSEEKDGDDVAEAEDSQLSTKETASRLFDSLLSTVSDVSQKIKTTVEKAADSALGDFNREQQKFVHTKQKPRASLPPWADCENEDAVREKVLALSADKRNFLRDPPPGSKQFVFEYEAYAGMAQATLAEDERLQRMRFELVPKQLTEEHFWENYFYRVSLIKSATVLANDVASDKTDILTGAVATSATAPATSSIATASGTVPAAAADYAISGGVPRTESNPGDDRGAAATNPRTASLAKDDPFEDTMSDASYPDDQFLGHEDSVDLDDLDSALTATTINAAAGVTAATGSAAKAVGAALASAAQVGMAAVQAAGASATMASESVKDTASAAVNSAVSAGGAAAVSAKTALAAATNTASAAVSPATSTVVVSSAKTAVTASPAVSGATAASAKDTPSAASTSAQAAVASTKDKVAEVTKATTSALTSAASAVADTAKLASSSSAEVAQGAVESAAALASSICSSLKEAAMPESKSDSIDELDDFDMLDGDMDFESGDDTNLEDEIKDLLEAA